MASVQAVLSLLEMRFDYQSARNVLNNWQKSIGRKDGGDLDSGALGSLAEYLEAEHDQAGDLASRIRSAGGGGKAPAKAAPKPEAKQEEKPAAKKDDKKKDEKKDDKKKDEKSGKKDDKKKKK